MEHGWGASPEDAEFFEMGLGSQVLEEETRLREIPLGADAKCILVKERQCVYGSTGSKIWGSSVALAQWLYGGEGPPQIKDKVVVEIGAGCGLPGAISSRAFLSRGGTGLTVAATGLTAGHLGASKVVFCDSSVEARSPHPRTEPSPVSGACRTGRGALPLFAGGEWPFGRAAPLCPCRL